MQPAMPCALTTKMEPQRSRRQRSLVHKLPLGQPVAAIRRRDPRLAVAIHPRVHQQAAVAAAIRHLVHQQVAAVAIHHQNQLPATVHLLRLLSHLLRAMAIVRRLNKPSGQKPIKDPRHRT